MTPTRVAPRLPPYAHALLLLVLLLLVTAPAVAATRTDLIPYDADADSYRHVRGGRHGGASQHVLPRASPGVLTLSNNVPVKSNIKMGEVQYYMVPKSMLSLPKTPQKGLPQTGSVHRAGDGDDGDGDDHDQHVLAKRKSKVALYITATTCLQPRPDDVTHDFAGAPQLALFVSTAEKPSSTDNAEKVVLEEGYANITLYPDDDIYIGVRAPRSADRTGVYNYHLAASVDRNFHDIDPSDPYLLFVDSDSTTALLWTNDTISGASPNDTVYRDWMGLAPPFRFFSEMADGMYRVAGLTRSYCGLAQNAIINGRDYYDARVTDKGLYHQPKQQFHVHGLNSSKTYWGYLAMDGNSTRAGAGVPGGGGKVWAPMMFNTKTENNTALLFDLDFCDEVAYAVPANPLALSRAQLAALYDNSTAAHFANFSKTLQVLPCEADPKGMYSLVSTCADCAAAYKKWLCAVTIPRASDFSDWRHWLLPRNVKQAFPNGTRLGDGQVSDYPNWALGTRNPQVIDRTIRPGPYKEMPPCLDLCYDISMTCPAALGFSCPDGDFVTRSYGYRADNGEVTCSYMGAAFNFNAAVGVRGRQRLLASLASLLGFWVLRRVVI
ncbi:stretch-activated cation channel mid1 [Ascosphaera acerosa]|nr:stretch-activated cation channel mid1 [Ascosphaera acerosa]